MRIIKEIATPGGAIAFVADKATVPVDGDGTGLTYGAYFDALEAFVSANGHEPLARALAAAGQVAGVDTAREVVLRAEKHGALYHPASCTVRFPEGEAKWCVNVASAPVAVACLATEAGLLEQLRERYAAPFLPCPLAYAEIDGLGMLLEEWFGGFHEFHQNGAGRIRLWDFDAGERLLSAAEAGALYGEAARILTRYFDPLSGAHVGPWHHAAGDFVARVDDAGVAVRLVTVRGYAAPRSYTDAGPMAERLAGLQFFTNMTMRMRLDRVDGVGELVLAGPEVVGDIVAGFAKALGERADMGDGGLGLLDFLGSFSDEELAGVGAQLMEPCPSDEQALLTAAWPEHGAALVAGLSRV